MKRKDSKDMSSNSKRGQRDANHSNVGIPSPALFEVLRVQEGKLQNIDYHNNRMNKALSKIFGLKDPIFLEKEIRIPNNLNNQVHKCRIIYTSKIEKIEFELYQLRKINSLKLVTHNSIDYSVKYYDRKIINELFEKRGSCDDILIIKNKFVTDISYANIVFWDGSQWITPSSPLLHGTKRQQLIDEQKIFEKEIKIKDIQSFEKARIINAMIDLEESNDILINNIVA